MTRLLATTMMLALLGSGCDVETEVGKLKPADGAPAADQTPADAGVRSDTKPPSDRGLVVTPDSDTEKSDGTSIICIPDELECEDLGSYRSCNPLGTAWLPVADCPPYQRCTQGSCVSAGKVTGSVKFFVSVKANQPWLQGQPELDIAAYPGALFEYDSSGLVDPVSSGPEGCQLVQAGTVHPPGIPFDAGDLQFQGLPGGTHTMTFDATEQRYETPSLPQNEPTFPYGQVVTFSSPGKGLVHGAFSGTLTLPPRRVFTRPAPREELNIPKNQPLDLTWSGSTGQGQIVIHVHELPDNIGPVTFTPDFQVRCRMNDDGAFTIPADIMSLYAPYPRVAFFMDMKDHQTNFDAQGLLESEVVVSYRYWATPVRLTD